MNIYKAQYRNILADIFIAAHPPKITKKASGTDCALRENSSIGNPSPFTVSNSELDLRRQNFDIKKNHCSFYRQYS